LLKNYKDSIHLRIDSAEYILSIPTGKKSLSPQPVPLSEKEDSSDRISRVMINNCFRNFSISYNSELLLILKDTANKLSVIIRQHNLIALFSSGVFDEYIIFLRWANPYYETIPSASARILMIRFFCK
jgi:hypothetical protein